MSNLYLIISFLSLIIITYFLLKITLPLFSKFLIDKPNSRSSHKIPTPNGGGLIIVFLGITYFLIQGYYFAILTIPLAIVSLIDDLKKVDYKTRLLFQGFTVASIYSGSNLYISSSDNEFLSRVLISILLVFLGTGFINFINFMDGLDGLLSASMTIIIGIICLKTNLTILPFIGILIGFLLLNWSPAKIFMGDIGSTFLAAICLGLIFDTTEFKTAFTKLLIFTPILGDASITVLLRLIKKQKLFNPHRMHLFQRLNKAGWSHSQVSLSYMAATLLLALVYYFFDINLLIATSFLVLLIGIYFDRFVATPIK